MKLVASVATYFITQLISRHALSVISLEMYRILMFVLICGCWGLARCKCELFALVPLLILRSIFVPPHDGRKWQAQGMKCALA